MADLVMAIRRQSQGFTRGASSFRGVSLSAATGDGGTPRYEARVALRNGRYASLGLHVSEADAGRAHDRAAVHLFGRGAATNWPLAEYGAELAAAEAREAGEAPPVPVGAALEDWLWSVAVPAGAAANRRSVRGPAKAPPATSLSFPSPVKSRSGARRPATTSPAAKRRASGRRPAKADTDAASVLAELACAAAVVSPQPKAPRRPVRRGRSATPGEGCVVGGAPDPRASQLALWLVLVVLEGHVADALLRSAAAARARREGVGEVVADA